MKKKLLYVQTEFSHLDSTVKRFIEKYVGYEVIHLNPTNPKFHNYKYKNKLEKFFATKILRPIFNIKWLDKKLCEALIREVESFGNFDLVFAISPNFAQAHKFWKYIRKKKLPMIVHFWDSFSFHKKQFQYIKYFDQVTCYDKKEAKKYNFGFVPNFYIESLLQDKPVEPVYDLFMVGSGYKFRVNFANNFAKYLKEIGINYKIIIPTSSEIKSDYITISDKGMSAEEIYDNNYKAKAILDIGAPNRKGVFQGGLSFRAPEAVGCKRKLITNLKIVKDYDFYRENNVAIISEDNYRIDKSFFETPYEEIPEEIRKSYSGESWAKKIFKNYMP